MLQRFVKPVIFVLFFLAIVTCAIVTGRGESFTNSFILGRYADFATQSPLLSLLLLIVFADLMYADRTREKGKLEQVPRGH